MRISADRNKGERGGAGRWWELWDTREITIKYFHGPIAKLFGIITALKNP